MNIVNQGNRYRLKIADHYYDNCRAYRLHGQAYSIREPINIIETSN